jgi:Bacteriophage translational regulator
MFEDGIGIEQLLEISLPNNENFLKVKETLTRIGITSKQENKLFQSCHILHKKGKYYIVHFKELFLLDGFESDMDENDIGRRNRIASLLEEWGLIKIIDHDKLTNTVGLNQIKIIAFSDKSNWQLCPKYHIGKKK